MPHPYRGGIFPVVECVQCGWIQLDPTLVFQTAAEECRCQNCNSIEIGRREGLWTRQEIKGYNEGGE